jgi:hypothetical protein
MGLPVDVVAVGDDTLATWAGQVKAAVDDLYAVVSDTSIGTSGTNFGAGTNVARTTLAGKDIYITLLLPVSTAFSTDANANLSPDILAFTLDAAYRPTEACNAVWGNGAIGGECIINTDGTINLRNGSAPSLSIAVATNVRITASFKKA